MLHDGVCWFLSAVLLLTNGWPVAIQHAHDVGNNPYHHSHGLDRLAAIAVTPAVSEVDGAVTGVTEHVHMLWFGWELTIVPPKGCRPSPCPSAAAAGLLARVEKTSGDRDTLTSQDLQVLASFVAQPNRTNARVRPSDSVLNIAALPLCDTARHLRSGVQLA
jgi:hypothetical protein